MYVPRGNKSAALNAVLETIGNSLVFFTDDDVRLAPTTLCAYAEAARNTGPGHFYGGPTRRNTMFHRPNGCGNTCRYPQPGGNRRGMSAAATSRSAFR